jgi:hypothetical protein
MNNFTMQLKLIAYLPSRCIIPTKKVVYKHEILFLGKILHNP